MSFASNPPPPDPKNLTRNLPRPLRKKVARAKKGKVKNLAKRKLVTDILKETGWWQVSDRVIAEVCRVSSPYVGNIRSELMAANPLLYPDLSTRLSLRDGEWHPMVVTKLKTPVTEKKEEVMVNDPTPASAACFDEVEEMMAELGGGAINLSMIGRDLPPLPLGDEDDEDDEDDDQNLPVADPTPAKGRGELILYLVNAVKKHFGAPVKYSVMALRKKLLEWGELHPDFDLNEEGFGIRMGTHLKNVAECVLSRDGFDWRRFCEKNTGWAVLPVKDHGGTYFFVAVGDPLYVRGADHTSKKPKKGHRETLAVAEFNLRNRSVFWGLVNSLLVGVEQQDGKEVKKWRLNDLADLIASVAPAFNSKHELASSAVSYMLRRAPRQWYADRGYEVEKCEGRGCWSIVQVPTVSSTPLFNGVETPETPETPGSAETPESAEPSHHLNVAELVDPMKQIADFFNPQQDVFQFFSGTKEEFAARFGIPVAGVRGAIEVAAPFLEASGYTVEDKPECLTIVRTRETADLVKEYGAQAVKLAWEKCEEVWGSRRTALPAVVPVSTYLKLQGVVKEVVIPLLKKMNDEIRKCVPRRRT